MGSSRRRPKLNLRMAPVWQVLRSGAGGAAENMATDEALLRAAPTIGCPVLRFYGWAEPAASFGYFQSYGEIEKLTELRPLVRRPTGGGLVPHAGDWTYSLVFPNTHEWYSLSAVESYQRVHLWVQSTFAKVGVLTSLAAEPRRDAPGQCFVGAEQFDVLSGGRKIAGAAQRRTRGGLLIQGSIQPPRGLSRADWETAFCAAGPPSQPLKWVEFSLGHELVQQVRELATEKYSQVAYNKKR
jgi:lipoyl(octanoyl) transferase